MMEVNTAESIETQAEPSDQKKESPLITQLKRWRDQKDRAALADLRRGLGRKPGEAMEMYPYIGRFLSDHQSESTRNALFTLASLFAYYPDAPGNVGNLGESMRRLSQKAQSESIEKRFVALLNADAEDLPYHLRQTIGLLRSEQVPVNWERLLTHVRGWNSDDRWVQKAWARSFWGGGSSQEFDHQQTPQEDQPLSDETGGTEE